MEAGASAREDRLLISVGLTGNVASGKSAVAATWRDAGVPVVDADQLAREAVAPGSEGLEEVREAFGDAVIRSDGTLDRERLASIVFRDAAARERLEAIVHPRVAELREAWLSERRAEGADLAVSEIPLLFEVGLEDRFDLTVVVHAGEAVRLRRLMMHRGMSEDDARARIAAQMDAEEKRRRADRVIRNEGTLEELEKAALALLAEIRPSSGDTLERLRIDLHLHTWASWDCLSDPERVLEAAARRGIARIAVTDHNRLEPALRLAERHPDRVIPGEEVRTSEGVDVIGHYLSEEIPEGTPARETVERIHEQGGVAYLPHPYASGKGGGGRLAEELAPLVDVVETFNARIHDPALNVRAQELRRRHARLAGAGSDAHTVREVGAGFVDVPAHPNRAAALLSALGHARVRGTESPRRVHLASTWAKLRKRLPGAPGP